MLRLLGVGFVAAIVLAAAAAGREPLTKQEYLSVVRSVVDPEATDRLLDDVVNYAYVTNGRYSEPCFRICRGDRGTLVDAQWLQAERHLRRDIDALTRRFEVLRPPRDVARLHSSWIAALKRCSAILRELEPDQKRFASGDFEHEVGHRLDAGCLDRLKVIVPTFEEQGYDFAPAS